MPVVTGESTGTMGLSVELDPSLWSPHDDHPGSSREEIDRELYRVALILAELGSDAPYGHVGSYSTGFKWRVWERDARGRDRPVKYDFWSTTMVSHPTETFASLRSAVQGVLTMGPEAEALRRYQLGMGRGGRRRVWIEVPEFTLRWVCGDCAPAPRRDTVETRKLKRAP